MNFLAHLLLAGDATHDRIGALLPDLVRGPVPVDLHPDIMAGVQLHRRIDAITDTHPIVARSRSRITRLRRRYNGIAIDMFYDHVLSRDWARYHRQDLRTYINHVYDDLCRNEDMMPHAMRPPVLRMRHGDWLGSYATVEGMSGILEMMSARLTHRIGHSIKLTDAIEDLVEHRDAISADFHAFFPNLAEQIGFEFSV